MLPSFNCLVQSRDIVYSCLVSDLFQSHLQVYYNSIKCLLLCFHTNILEHLAGCRAFVSDSFQKLPIIPVGSQDCIFFSLCKTKMLKYIPFLPSKKYKANVKQTILFYTHEKVNEQAVCLNHL